MLLLAEAYTVNNQTAKALQMYNDILDARTANNPSSGSGESTKDIYRKMAPLYQKQENYTVAA